MKYRYCLTKEIESKFAKLEQQGFSYPHIKKKKTAMKYMLEDIERDREEHKGVNKHRLVTYRLYKDNVIELEIIVKINDMENK